MSLYQISYALIGISVCESIKLDALVAIGNKITIIQ